MTFAFTEEEDKYIYYNEEGELCIHFLCPTDIKNSIFKKLKDMESVNVGYEIEKF